MKKLLTITALLISLSLVATANHENEIRKKFFLGKTIRAVLRSNGTPAKVLNEYFYYDVDFAGIDVQKVFYHGKMGSIYMVGIFAKTSFRTESEYISEYLSLNKKLTKKYGEFKNNLIWNNDLYKTDKKYWGFAIRIGHLEVERTLEFKNIRIIHRLKSIDKTIFHTLCYVDIKLNDVYMKALKKKRSEDI